jgi:uroporphyrin-III C-methyltransferase
MSESSSNSSSAPDPGPAIAARQAEAEAALARLATFGQQRKRDSGILGWAFVLLLLALLAAVGGLAWLLLSQRDEVSALRADYATLQQQNADSANRVALLQQSQQDLNAGVQQELERELQDTNAALVSRLAALESELVATRLRVSSIDSGGSPLAEAEVLLRFAQQRLVLAGDTVTAVALFRDADAILRSIDDATVNAIRDILARELAALAAVQSIDTAGIFA